MTSARRLIEHRFCTRKPSRGIAARHDETKRNSLVGAHLAASTIPLNRGHALASWMGFVARGHLAAISIGGPDASDSRHSQ